MRAGTIRQVGPTDDLASGVNTVGLAAKAPRVPRSVKIPPLYRKAWLCPVVGDLGRANCLTSAAYFAPPIGPAAQGATTTPPTATTGSSSAAATAMAP